MRSVLTFLSLLVVLAPGLAYEGPKQQSSGDNEPSVSTVKVTSRLVLIDVIADDSQGHPVTDLKPADFTVLEDGHQQRLKAFSFDCPERRAKELQQSAVQQLPPGVYTNMPEFQPATAPPTILLLDGLNTPFQDQVQAKKMMVRVLEKLDPHSKVAIYLLTGELRLLQNFTSDTGLLLAALNRLHPSDTRMFNNAHEAVALPIQEMPAINVPAGAGGVQQVNGTPSLDPAENVLNRMQDTVKTFEAEQQEYKDTFRAGRTLEALKAISHATQGYAGRKNLIWISGSFPFSVLPDPSISSPHKAEHSYEREVLRTASLLTDAQIAMYPVQAIGLTHTMGDASFAGHDAYRDVVRGGGSTGELRRLASDDFNATSSMETLADETGGRAYHNRNDIDGAVLESLNDGATYYTLGYTSDNQKYDGRFRTIQVKVNRPGVHLRHRKGYFGENPANESQNAKEDKDLAPELRDALVFDPMPATGVGFFAKLLPLQKDNKFAFDIRVDASGLMFQAAGNDRQQTKLQLAAAAFDAENHPTAFESYAITAPLSSDQYVKVQKMGLPFRFQMAYDPKVTRVRLAIRDNSLGTVGTVDVDVRNLSK